MSRSNITFAVLCGLASLAATGCKAPRDACLEGDMEIATTYCAQASDASGTIGTATDTSSTEPGQECGNGQVEGTEECDDGANNGSGQPCNASCQANVCGDGDQLPTEECDDGNKVSGDGCSAECVDENCGNGVEDGDEECDDGKNGDQDDGCTDNCRLPACGDSFVQMSLMETCDDGPDNADNAGCTTECRINECGDGAVYNTGDGTEECDDGADNGPGKNCNAQCKLNICGDGDPLAGVEACDDGNDDNTDGCVTGCKLAECGDGFVFAGTEECDDNGVAPNDGCSSTCTHEYLMFATKALHLANFGGVAAADAICKTAATAASLPGTYVAWLSFDTDNASTDLPMGKTLLRTDGATIVAAAGDLIKGGMTALMNPIDRDEDGSPVTGYAWTGTSFTGQATGTDCEGWTVANGNATTIGNLSSTISAWTNEPGPDPFSQLQCSATNHLYCFRKAEP